jgi:cellulose synthase (UDP-forming)
VRGLYEETVTEDVATSIIMHGRNLKSIYMDLPLICMGRPPWNYKSYYVQQNRWVLRTYQSLKLMLKEDIGIRRLLDYLNRFFYWLHIGPLAIADIIAPLMFLVLGVFFLRLNPLNYILVYIPIFSARF